MYYEKILEDILQSCEYESLKKELFEETKKRISICENDVKEKKALKENLTKQLEKLEHEHDVLLLHSKALSENFKKLHDSISELKELNTKLEYENNMLLDGKKNQKEELRKKFLAYCTAMAYYKKNLCCYIDIERETGETVEFFFHFFISEKHEKKEDYYVKFEYSSGKWKVLDLKPDVDCAKRTCKYLKKTGDVLGFLSHIRSLFLAKKSNEKCNH